MVQRGETAAAREVLELGRDEDVPVGTQLGWRLRALILSGRLAAGERLPGVRELAAGAGVNVNTARAIYRRLEADGLAVSKHGLGTFVAAATPARPAIEQIAADAVEAAQEQGINPRDLAQTIYVGSGAQDLGPAVEEGTPGLGADATEVDRLAARGSLRSQIARLEAQLAPYTKHLGLEPPEEAPRSPGGRIADIGELESVRDALVARLAAARSRAEAEGRTQEAARAKLEKMMADPAGNQFEIVTNAQMGEPGCTTYEVRPAWGPVGALMSWWQVRVSGGCPLPGPPRAARRAGA